MRWQNERESMNVEDRRGGGIVGGGLKLSGVGLLVILVISIFTGQNPLKLVAYLLQQQPQASTGTQEPSQGSPQQGGYDEQKKFVSVVLASTEDVWTQVLAQANRQYEPPKLILFSDEVQSACGLSSAAVGPFYCPQDSQVYLDLSFFQELNQRFGAPGDFAQAYVIAHEVGHHVQKLLGIFDQQEQRSGQQANDSSVRMELQADCFAGVWGYHANKEKQMLEPGDVEEGLNAAAAVGDDRLQQQSGRSVSPESWTHGSSQMRVTWFRRGFESGQINSCDTFSTNHT